MPFPIQFACDRSPEDGGPPAHKHTGVVYTLTPPKQALGLKWSMKINQRDPAKVGTMIHRWLDKAFGVEVANQIRFRLYGPDDDDLLDEAVVNQEGEPVLDTEEDPLDVEDVMACMKFVTERTAGVPPM